MILEIAEPLLASVAPFRRRVRMLGIALSSLNTEESGQNHSSLSTFDATALKTKTPTAGGGAAGFPKRTELRLGGGVPLFRQTPLGRRSGPSEFEALREEVHRFDETKLPVSAAHETDFAAVQLCKQRKILGGFRSPEPSPGVGEHIQKRPRHQRA